MINKKPKITPAPQIDAKEADSFAKAANVMSVKSPVGRPKKIKGEPTTTGILINFPEAAELTEHIEQLSPQRGKKLSRHAWIVAAIYEKWEREKKKK